MIFGKRKARRRLTNWPQDLWLQIAILARRVRTLGTSTFADNQARALHEPFARHDFYRTFTPPIYDVGKLAVSIAFWL